MCRLCRISIHAPTRGATTSFAATICKLRLFQSTLLQEERLGADIMFLCSDNISIHAPTRGATVSGSMVYPVLSNFNPRSYKRSDALAPFLLYPAFIFQSTLLQEERQKTPLTDAFNEEFQSTLLQEERPNPPDWENMSEISIHAPTRGATGISRRTYMETRISIHAPTRGATD